MQRIPIIACIPHLNKLRGTLDISLMLSLVCVNDKAHRAVLLGRFLVLCVSCQLCVSCVCLTSCVRLVSANWPACACGTIATLPQEALQRLPNHWGA